MAASRTFLSTGGCAAIAPARSLVPPQILRRFNIKFSIQRNNSLYYGRRFLVIRSKKPGKVHCSDVDVVDGIDNEEACELVNGVDLVIGEGDDAVSAYLLKAVKNNNGTGILLLSDILGFEDSSTREFAYRVACHGYNVLVPDLFRRNPWKKVLLPSAEFSQWLATQTPERVSNDIDLSAKWLSDEFAAAGISKKLGIIGFCYGGRQLIETLAHDKDSRFGSGICFYGTNMEPSVAGNIKVPVLFVCGDDDPLCSVSTVKQMTTQISGSKSMIYCGRKHGFAHRPETLEEDKDAEEAFLLAKSWMHDTLLVQSAT